MTTQKSPDADIFTSYQGMGEAVEPSCGDVTRIYLRTRREVITEIDFTITETACLTAKVCVAAACKLAKDKPVMEAYLVDKDAVAAEVGGLPPESIHCAIMAELALKRAIVNYSQNRTGVTL